MQQTYSLHLLVNETILTKTASTMVKLPRVLPDFFFYKISNCLRIFEIAWVLPESAEKVILPEFLQNRGNPVFSLTATEVRVWMSNYILK